MARPRTAMPGPASTPGEALPDEVARAKGSLRSRPRALRDGEGFRLAGVAGATGTGRTYDQVMDAGRRWPLRIGIALVAPALAAIALTPLRAHLLNANLALVLVLVVLGAAVAGGRVAGMVAAASAIDDNAPKSAVALPVRAHGRDLGHFLLVLPTESFGLRVSGDTKHAAVALADQLAVALLRHRRP
jgi:hypothetical protein